MNTEIIKRRQKNVRLKMEEKGLDYLILSSPEAIFYFSGIYSSYPSILIIENDRAILFSMGSENAAWSKQSCGKQIICDDPDALYKSIDLEFKITRDCILGVELERVNYKFLKELNLKLENIVDMSGPLKEIMVQKEDWEIEIIKENTLILEETFKELSNFIKPGVSEIDIYLKTCEIITHAHGEVFCWEGCIGSGARSANPDAQPYVKPLAGGDLVLIDLYPKLRGYYCDMTRTFAVGQIDDKVRKMYNILEEALDLAKETIKPGMLAGDLDKIIRDFVKSKAGDYTYTHHTGHGIGLYQIESPLIVKDSNDIIKANQVMAIEPGIYMPGIGGIRLENCYIVSNDGCECINKFPLYNII